jgi:hypothetical protein
MQISELEVFLRLSEREFTVPVNPGLREVPFNVPSGPQMPRRKSPLAFSAPAKRVAPPNVAKNNSATLRCEFYFYFFAESIFENLPF